MGKFVEVAKTSDIEPGEAISFEAGDGSIAVFNVDGKYYAIEDRCTHRDAPLSQGEVMGNVVVCPFHAAEFDIKTGEALCQPATEPVKTYNVRVEGDSIMVEID